MTLFWMNSWVIEYEQIGELSSFGRQAARRVVIYAGSVACALGLLARMGKLCRHC